MKNTLTKALKKFLPEKGFHYSYYYHRKRIGWLLKAYLQNQAFCCQALKGESNYNICINCDLTVSCNCQDFDGSGVIGNLREQTFQQIFDSEKAKSFRQALSRRRFPLRTCPVCAELSAIPKSEITSVLTGYRVPYRGVMVENTVLCNLRCNFCNRAELLRIREVKSLSLEDTAIIANVLQQHEIENLYFFNLGEPFLPANVCDQLRLIRAQNPEIRIITSTNGCLLDRDDKLEAALQMDYVNVSLNGVDKGMVSKYQVGSDFDKAYGNMAKLVQVRNQKGISQPIIVWKYVLFRWNDHPKHIMKAVEMARRIGIDSLAFYPGEAPLIKRSLRHPRHPIFRKVGEYIDGVTIVNLSGIPRHLLLP